MLPFPVHAYGRGTRSAAAQWPVGRRETHACVLSPRIGLHAYAKWAAAPGFVHDTECRGCEPQTHEAVIAEMHAMRKLSLTENRRRVRQPLASSFSAHCASEHLLRDVVKDTSPLSTSFTSSAAA